MSVADRDLEARRLPPFQPGETVRLEQPAAAQDAPFLGWEGTYQRDRGDGSSVVRWTAQGGLQGKAEAGGTYVVTTRALRRVLAEELPPEGTIDPALVGPPEVLE